MAEKQKRKVQGPKAFYLIYDVTADGEIEVHMFSRKTDDVLTALSDHDGAKVKKLMAPAGR